MYPCFQFIKEKSVSSFDFVVTTKTINKTYSVEGYDILVKSNQEIAYFDFFHAIKYAQGISYATLSDRFYVSKDKKNTPVTVYSVTISKTSAKSQFGKKEYTSVSEVKNNLIFVELNKEKK